MKAVMLTVYEGLFYVPDLRADTRSITLPDTMMSLKMVEITLCTTNCEKRRRF